MNVGDRFARLTFVATTDACFGRPSSFGIFVCECGQHTVMRFSQVRNGRSTQCRYCERRRIDGNHARRATESALRRKFDRETVRIRMVTGERVRKGFIKNPRCCEICESTHKVGAHHESYLKPDDVIFLCSRHHHARHKRLSDKGCDPSLLYAQARSAGAPNPLTRSA